MILSIITPVYCMLGILVFAKKKYEYAISHQLSILIFSEIINFKVNVNSNNNVNVNFNVNDNVNINVLHFLFTD